MGSRNSYAPIGVAIAVLVVLQLALIAADCRQTTVRTAEKFARNYFSLNAKMQEQLCTQIVANTGAVQNFLHLKTAEVVRRGFKPSFARRVFTKIHLNVLAQDDTTARIHVAGETRTSINHAMMVIGKWFHLGKTYPVEMTLDLVKENGRWRVCGDALGQAV